MEHGTFFSVGEKWPPGVFDMPDEDLSFGWHSRNLLVIGDPNREVDLSTYIQSPIRLGFAEFGPLPILAFRADGLPASLDAAQPYLPGDDPPEVTLEPGEHILWQTVLVQAGVVTNIRAFTTSQAVTVLLRRVAAIQRAWGPLTFELADEWLRRWHMAAPSENVLWARCTVQCWSGD